MTRFQTVPRSSSTCGRERVDRRVRSQAIATPSAGLELDRLGLVALVGLRIGIEALAGCRAEPALGDQAPQDPRRREALAVLLFGLSSRSSTLSRPADVGAHERRQQAAARVEPRPGHHPEVDLAEPADALLEQQAGLDERLQRELLDERVAIGLAVALDLRLAVLVDALAAALGAELAVGDQLLHALVDVEASP